MSDSQTIEAAIPVGRSRRRLGLVAVMLGVFVAALDLLAPQLGALGAAIGTQAPGERLPAGAWVPIVGHTIVWIASLPLWGKLSDIHGRRRAWLAGLLLFMVGTVGALTSQELIQFTISRLAGALGVGAIFALGPALIGGMHPPAERAKWQGALAAALGLGLIAGPTIAFLIQWVLWQYAGGWISFFHFMRWPLVPSLLFGGLVLLASWRRLPTIRTGARPRVDYAGAVAFVGTLAPLMLVLQLAGGFFAWLSVPAIALLGGTAVMLMVLLIVARRASDPMIDVRFLTNRSFLVPALTMSVVMTGLSLSARYAPYSFQVAIDRGLAGEWDWMWLSPLGAMAFGASALVAGQVAARTGRYRPLILALLIIATAGVALLSRMDGLVTRMEIARNLVIAGLGLGGLFALLLVAVQNAFPRRYLGAVTAGLVFFGFFGSFVGRGVVNRLESAWADADVEARVSVETQQPLGLQGLDLAAGPQGNATGLAPEILFHSRVDSLSWVFSIVAVLLAIGFVLVTLLPKIPVVTETETDWDEAFAAEPLGRGETAAKTFRRPSLQEGLRAGQEEHRKGLGAAKARAEQRHRAVDAAMDDSDATERATGGPQPSDS